jgi:hypothetical protein
MNLPTTVNFGLDGGGTIGEMSVPSEMRRPPWEARCS